MEVPQIVQVMDDHDLIFENHVFFDPPILRTR